MIVSSTPKIDHWFSHPVDQSLFKYAGADGLIVPEIGAPYSSALHVGLAIRSDVFYDNNVVLENITFKNIKVLGENVLDIVNEGISSCVNYLNVLNSSHLPQISPELAAKNKNEIFKFLWYSLVFNKKFSLFSKMTSFTFKFHQLHDWWNLKVKEDSFFCVYQSNTQKEMLH